jgi:hypothetical protein
MARRSLHMPCHQPIIAVFKACIGALGEKDLAFGQEYEINSSDGHVRYPKT